MNQPFQRNTPMKKLHGHVLTSLLLSGLMMACGVDEVDGYDTASVGGQGDSTAASSGQGGDDASSSGQGGDDASSSGQGGDDASSSGQGGGNQSPAEVTTCVTQAQLMGINDETNYWPECTSEQAVPKGSIDKSLYIWTHICSDEQVVELNRMLCSPSVDLCRNDAVSTETRHRFLAQMAHETGYYTTMAQPLDAGSGMLHMIPANWEINVKDMEEIFPGEGILAHYQSLTTQQERSAFFTQPRFAWKSAAAWMMKTNRLIPGCGENLLDGTASFERMTQCILGGPSNRTEAYNLTGKFLGEYAEVSQD